MTSPLVVPLWLAGTAAVRAGGLRPRGASMTTTSTGTSDLSVVTSEHPNAVTMRRAFEAFGRGDLESVRQSLADDCTWTQPGSTPISGVYRGWDEISSMFLRLFELTGGTHRNTLLDVLAGDSRAVAVYDATSTVDGRTATHRNVLVNEVDTSGRATTCTNLPYDLEAFESHMGTRQQ